MNAHLQYDTFLKKLDLLDKKKALGECGLEAGKELEQLKEMDDDELDAILEDKKLELDDETISAFREAVEALQTKEEAQAKEKAQRAHVKSKLKDTGSENLTTDVVVAFADHLSLSKADD